MFNGTSGKILKALESYDLKQTGKNQYRCNSPFRQDSDSHGFTLTITDDEHGAWQDYPAGTKGSLYDLARHLGIKLPDKETTISSKRAYTGIADYAMAHGITAAELLAAGWRQVEKDKRPALQFETDTGSRWRYLDGNKPYYTSTKGYQKCWYGLKRIGTMVMKGQPVVICNGEISVIAGQAHGIAAIAVTSGEGEIPAHLIDELKSALDFVADENTEIHIALDCDHRGREAARTIQKQLSGLGWRVRALDMKLHDKGDLADFCKLHKMDAPLNLPLCDDLGDPIQTEIPHGIKVYAQGRGWYLMHAKDRDKIPPVEWLFPGEIPKRSISVLYAPPGAGKSFVAVDYALRLAQTAPVVYLASEGESGYRARIDAWCKHHDKMQGELYLCLGAVSLMEDDQVEAFMQPLRQIKPAMIIVDTLADSMMGADENSTRDVGEYMSKVHRIKRELDTTMLLIHHTNKGGIQERGNIRIRGSADSVMRLIPEDDIMRLEASKLKDARAFPARELALMTITVTIDGKETESAVIVPAERIIPDASRLTTNQQKILSVFDLEVFSSGAEVADIVDLTDLGRGSVQRALSRLLRLSLVAQDGKKSPYTLTEKGQQALTRMTRMTRMNQNDTGSEVKCNPVIQPSQSSQPSHEGLRMFKEMDGTAMKYYTSGA